jgi:hypothetical protein
VRIELFTIGAGFLSLPGVKLCMEIPVTEIIPTLVMSDAVMANGFLSDQTSSWNVVLTVGVMISDKKRQSGGAL